MKPSDVRSEIVRIRLTKRELALVKKALRSAKLEGDPSVTVAEFCRNAVAFRCCQLEKT